MDWRRGRRDRGNQLVVVTKFQNGNKVRDDNVGEVGKFDVHLVDTIELLVNYM